VWNGFGGAAGIFSADFAFPDIFPGSGGRFSGAPYSDGHVSCWLEFWAEAFRVSRRRYRVPLYAPFPLVLAHMHDMVVVRQGKME
jgi:hypothetical protein